MAVNSCGFTEVGSVADELAKRDWMRLKKNVEDGVSDIGQLL